MQCPKRDGELVKTTYHDIEVDECNHCGGYWLDPKELDAVEDRGFDVDELKGSLTLKEKPGNLVCPHCQDELRAFRYRFNDLELDVCPAGHGWWLDVGEVGRIEQLMKKREEAVVRAEDAEADWVAHLNRLRSTDAINWVRNFLEERAE